MRVRSLHHTHFAAPDLDLHESFAKDFGLATVTRTADRLVMRAPYGADAYNYIVDRAEQTEFKGYGYLVESMSDLDEAAARFGGSPIVTLDRPGGGFATTLHDFEGVAIELIAGETPSIPANACAPLVLNLPGAVNRLNRPQSHRPTGPVQLFGLGHSALYVRDIDQQIAWYGKTLGMKVTDVGYDSDTNKTVVAFMRLDKGSETVDHHVLALVAHGRTDCHHISFHTQDFEAQMRAHRWLLSRQHRPVAGVGRHGLGSHVFDTWFGPGGCLWETFSDTDAFNADWPTGYHDIKGGELDFWVDDPVATGRYFAL